jgi:hypothetical protein
MKRFACWIGRHRWETHVEQGESYTVSSACGKIPNPPRSGPRGTPVVDTTEGGPGASKANR